MVYTMVYYVDGGCRGNGNTNAIGAAAIVEELKFGRTRTYAWELRSTYHQPVTNQRAEISAIIFALKRALERYRGLDTSPWLNVTIHTDARYAASCMNEWIYKWTRNGWINAAGKEVANKDLISKASDLDDEVKELGSVTYKWIPRAQNQDADTACNNAMDNM